MSLEDVLWDLAEEARLPHANVVAADVPSHEETLIRLLSFAVDLSPWDGGKLYATCQCCDSDKEYEHSEGCSWVAWHKEATEILERRGRK